MKNITIIMMIILVFFSCDKTIEEPMEENSLYQQVWETRFHPETFVVHDHPYIYKNDIIIAQYNGFDKKVDYNIAGYDKKNGTFLWGWNHPDVTTVVLHTFLEDHIFLVQTRKSIFAFDVISKDILWEILFDEYFISGGGFHIEGGRLFSLTEVYSSDSFVIGTEIREYDIYTGMYKIHYSEYKNDVKPYIPYAGKFTFIPSENNDELVVFEVRYIETQVSPRVSLPDLICLDLNSGEIRWRKTDYNELASGFNRIKHHKGKLYNTGDWSLYAFDPETGDELNRWQFLESKPLGSFNNADFTIVNDVVYTLDDLGHLNGVNTVTEQLEFSYQKGAANTQSPPVIHNDLILYSSFGHQAIEIFDTKKQIFVHKEREKSAGFQIVHDEETDLYYTIGPEIIHSFRIND